MKNLIKSIFIFLLAVSCSKDPGFHGEDYVLGGGVFILNEGNFRGGNGSLSFYSYDSSKIFNDIFYSANKRPLGDVPNSMIINEEKAYIVVNNSGKIEVINHSTLQSITTIDGLISPRNIAVINSSKAYVTSLYSDSVVIIDLHNNSVSGYINIRRSSEAITVTGNKAYVSNWMGGNEIMVINTLNNNVVDSIEVGYEPESMVIDRTGTLWVLCDGGWSGDNFAKLVEISIFTDEVEKEYVFPTLEAFPSCLKINSFGQTLYYLDNGVRVMDINAEKLPASTFISDDGASFYKIAINPSNGDIFVTDAVDYTQQGYLLLYKNDGTLVSKERADIIPGSMYFKLRYN